MNMNKKIGILIIFVILLAILVMLLFVSQTNKIPVNVASNKIFSCAKEGEAIGAEDMPESCCAGLKAVGGWPGGYQGDCTLPSPPTGLKICTKCGDGICDIKNGENKCNCSGDCATNNSSNTQSVATTNRGTTTVDWGGYRIIDNKVYHLVVNAEASSFRPLNESEKYPLFFRDRWHIYYKGRIIPYANPDKFKIIKIDRQTSQNFYQNNDNVYYINNEDAYIIKGLKPGTFKIYVSGNIEDGFFYFFVTPSKVYVGDDQGTAYSLTELAMDPKSFQIISGYSAPSVYLKNQKAVYYLNYDFDNKKYVFQKIPQADPNSIHCSSVRNGGTMCKDKSYLFLGGQAYSLLKHNIDIASFKRMAWSPLFVDKNHVYYIYKNNLTPIFGFKSGSCVCAPAAWSPFDFFLIGDDTIYYIYSTAPSSILKPIFKGKSKINYGYLRYGYFTAGNILYGIIYDAGNVKKVEKISNVSADKFSLYICEDNSEGESNICGTDGSKFFYDKKVDTSGFCANCNEKTAIGKETDNSYIYFPCF